MSLLSGPLKNCHASDAKVLAALGGLRETQDVAIAAEGPVTLGVSSVAGVRCEFRAKFTPDPGAQYRLTYRTVQGGCLLSLERRSHAKQLDAAGPWIAEPYADPNPECNK